MANIKIGSTVKLIGLSSCHIHLPSGEFIWNGYVCGMDPETVTVTGIIGGTTLIGNNGRLYPLVAEANDDFYAVVSVADEKVMDFRCMTCGCAFGEAHKSDCQGIGGVLPHPLPTVRSVSCKVCGEPMAHGGTLETLVGYISPAGHDHDDNCQSRVYTCKNGHKMEVSKRRRCSVPGCDWWGKATCFCHRDPKVDKWPEEV